MDHERCTTNGQGHVERAELQEGHECRCPGDQRRANVRRQVEHPRHNTPYGRVFQPQGPIGQACGHAHQHTREDLHQQIALNLVGNVFQHMDGDLAALQAGACNAQQLVAKQVTRGQCKKREKHHHRELA